MHKAASPKELEVAAKDISSIVEDLRDIAHILNDKEEPCNCCGLNVREHFQQYLWKKTLNQIAKRLSQTSQEMVSLPS
jgi:hypothetical protein